MWPVNSQLLHFHHLELISKHGTLETHGKKTVLFGLHCANCSHGATIAFTQAAVYLTELDANIYPQNSGY